jgi:transposase-like protein
MPSKETEPMNERVKFIAAYLEKDESFFGTCERFGISRKTGYKWVERKRRRRGGARREIASAEPAQAVGDRPPTATGP